MKNLLLLSILFCGCGSNLLSDEQAKETDFYVGEPTTALFPPEPAQNDAIENPVYFLPETWSYISIADSQQTIYIVNYSLSMTVIGAPDLNVSYQVHGTPKKAAGNGEGDFHIPLGADFIRIDTQTNIYILYDNKIFASHYIPIHYGIDGVLTNKVEAQ